MADIDATVVIPLGLTVLAGIVAAVEKLSKVRRNWRFQPMQTPDSTPEPAEPVPSRRRPRPSEHAHEHEPLTRAEIEARLHAIAEDIARIEAAVAKLDDWRDRFEVEMVRGIGGINTRLETLRGRIAGVYELVTRTSGRRR
jgi:hypothetical protein